MKLSSQGIATLLLLGYTSCIPVKATQMVSREHPLNKAERVILRERVQDEDEDDEVLRGRFLSETHNRLISFAEDFDYDTFCGDADAPDWVSERCDCDILTKTLQCTFNLGKTCDDDSAAKACLSSILTFSFDEKTKLLGEASALVTCTPKIPEQECFDSHRMTLQIESDDDKNYKAIGCQFSRQLAGSAGHEMEQCRTCSLCSHEGNVGFAVDCTNIDADAKRLNGDCRVPNPDDDETVVVVKDGACSKKGKAKAKGRASKGKGGKMKMKMGGERVLGAERKGTANGEKRALRATGMSV